MCRILAARSSHIVGRMAVDDALQAALGGTEPIARHTGAPRRPQRNPAFSTTSRLVVLREPAPTAPTAPSAAERTFTDPTTLPDTDASTYTPRNVQGFAQHDLVLSEYESRSHWHKQRTRGEASMQLPSTSTAQADASPPSFFSHMFPERAPPRWSEMTSDAPSPPPAAAPRPVSPPTEDAPVPASPASLRSLSPECEASPASTAHGTAGRVAARIEVRGWRRVGTPMHGWVVYDIHVRTPSVRFLTDRRGTSYRRTNATEHFWSWLRPSHASAHSRRPRYRRCRLGIRDCGIGTIPPF